MPRRMPASYGEVMDMVKDTQSKLIQIVRLPRIPPTARDLLLELIEQHAEMIARNDGMGRRLRPPSAAPMQAPDNIRIS